MIRKPIICLASLFGLVALVHAQGTTVMTVDLNRVFNEYEKIIDAQEKFQTTVRTANEELQALVEEAQELAEEFRNNQALANNDALREAARTEARQRAEELAQEIQIKEREVQEFRQRTQQQLARERDSILQQNLGTIREIVAEVARRRDADLVVNSAQNNSVVIFADPNLDITDEVIERLNEQG